MQLRLFSAPCNFYF
ncbi:hypothetical protein AASJ52_09830 [Salmonella enterica subsp. enterica serovar Paratyphi A]|nr:MULTISPECIES: hypothetical protein [Salmonella]MDJ3518144.1 hypothetical protein [Salmonella enterica]MDJ3526473.1 hypothetical protein [Salmonella enterica]MDJ3548173.1 hypothetical protein [Salmonella enterica]MDJ3591082.1 hypothetical protein [Salmonella enterica]MDJ3603822.1 hypothetical protein [Salmonella enterica]